LSITQKKVNNFLQTYTDRQIYYDVSEASGRYIDKFMGSPVIRSYAELRNVLDRHRRAWIVAAPYSAFESNDDKATIDYIVKGSKIVYESYETKVYLWER
jgi:hypothetical protein